jgi:hypothetical protein
VHSVLSRAPGKCFGCVTVLQLSVEYSGQLGRRVKGFGKAGVTRDVGPLRWAKCPSSLMKVSSEAMVPYAAPVRAMKLS